MNYSVPLTAYYVGSLSVDADSPEEAQKKVQELLDEGHPVDFQFSGIDSIGYPELEDTITTKPYVPEPPAPPFCIVPMPYNAQKQGPEMDSTKVVGTDFEIWDSLNRSFASFATREYAEEHLLILNKEYPETISK